MTKPRFRQINIAEISDAAIDRINDSLNVPKLLRSTPTPVTPARPPSVEPSRWHVVDALETSAPTIMGRHKLTVRIPQGLNDAMKRDALDHRTHVNIIILTALQAAGYNMPASDVLAPDEAARLRFVILSRQSSVEPSNRHQVGPSVQQKLTINTAASLDETMKRDALTGRTTVRGIVLLALRVFGYWIDDADVAPGAGGNC